MAEKKKLSPAEKIRIAKLCIEGKIGPRAAARQVGVGMSTIQQWVSMYEFQGEDAFRELENYTTYSSEVKAKAVNDYLAGKGSQQTIAALYGLRSKTQLQKWIKMYNEGKDFLNKMSGGSRMTTSRKTTKEERIKSREWLQLWRMRHQIQRQLPASLWLGQTLQRIRRSRP